MNAGLPQGFVRFGTRHEFILRALHQLGPMPYTDLMDEMGLECRRRAYAAIKQLLAAGLIYRHPKIGGHGSGERAMYIFSLEPNRNREAYKPDSGAARSRRYRERKAAQTLTHGWLRGLA